MQPPALTELPNLSVSPSQADIATLNKCLPSENSPKSTPSAGNVVQTTGTTSNRLTTRPAPDEQQELRHEQILRKANEAITIRPRLGKLTLLSRRIYNVLLYHAKKQGDDKPCYRLALVELIGDARFNSKNTKLLKSHLREMQATTIEWATSSEGQNKWVSTQLLGTVTIEEPGRGLPCMIEWNYPDEIRERLLKPMPYTKVDLEIGARMSSLSAAVLYEIGTRYLTLPGGLSMRGSVPWWKEVLTGRGDIKEVEYRFFKRDYIAGALIQVNTFCEDFSIELVEHTLGRRIVEIQFRIVPKPRQPPGGMNDHNMNACDHQLVERLMAIGFTSRAAEDRCATTDKAKLETALEVVEQRLGNKTLTDIKSPVAYFRHALDNGYTSHSDHSRAAKGAAAKVVSTLQLSDSAQLQRIHEASAIELDSKAKGMFDEMSEIKKSEVKLRFETEKLPLLARPVSRDWARNGPNGRIASSSFIRWLAEITWGADR